MQIISEIAEIIASAADGGLVLYFFVQYFGKKDKIRWWEYVIWMSAFFVDAHFLNDHANVQACIMIILVWAFSIIYLKGKNVKTDRYIDHLHTDGIYQYWKYPDRGIMCGYANW